MKIKYAPEVNAAFISFKPGPSQVTTVRLTEDIAVDFGPKEETVGIEVLEASKHMGFRRGKPRILLENMEPA